MKALVAMDINRGIGYKGNLPWPPLHEDFRFFKKKTMETKKIIMGRDTFQSVGTLKDRFTYVLTTDSTLLALPPFVSYRYVSPDFFKKELHCDMWLCGGAKTYKLLLPYCTEVFVTHVLNEYDIDTYMPEFEDKFTKQEIIAESKEFWIVRYFDPLDP